MCIQDKSVGFFFCTFTHWRITFGQRGAWILSRPRWRQTESSRWWWWSGSFHPGNPEGSESSYCHGTARGFSTTHARDRMHFLITVFSDIKYSWSLRTRLPGLLFSCVSFDQVDIFLFLLVVRFFCKHNYNNTIAKWNPHRVMMQDTDTKRRFISLKWPACCTFPSYCMADYQRNPSFHTKYGLNFFF